MILHCLRKRTENDPQLGELSFERRCDRNAIEHRIDGDAGQRFLFVERDAQLLVHLEQLRIDLFQTLWSVRLRFRRRIITDRLVVDGRIMHHRPLRLSLRFFQLRPMAVSFKPPFEHERRLVLFRGDEANDLFVQPGRNGVGFDIGDETVLVLAPGQIFDRVCGIFHFCSLLLLNRE